METCGTFYFYSCIVEQNQNQIVRKTIVDHTTCSAVDFINNYLQILSLNQLKLQNQYALTISKIRDIVKTCILLI